MQKILDEHILIYARFDKPSILKLPNRWQYENKSDTPASIELLLTPAIRDFSA